MYVEGFTYTDWYYMPVYIRNFYLDKINKLREEEKKQADQKMGVSTNNVPESVRRQWQNSMK